MGNNKKSVVETIIKQMTLEEKAELVNGATLFCTAENKRLGIPFLQTLDGGTGINFEQLLGDMYFAMEDADSTNGMVGQEGFSHVQNGFYETERLTEEEKKLRKTLKEKLDERTTMPELAPGCFPPGILLGATFNPLVVHQVGEALGKEAIAYHIDILLGTPNVNILRDPLNGRFFEGYSEDPYLVSVLAPELVKGVQEYPVGANVKHFAANNQETNRIGINETISKRALEEIYLPGFRACVEGGVRTVMSAYNKINGVPCTENDWLLKETLRGEWGFDGFVMSDWGAVYHPVEAIKSGNDLAMPGPIDGKPLVDAVREGKLDEKVLDEAVINILHYIFWLHEKKDNWKDKKLSAKELMKQTDEVAYRAAAEGIVLLKNENGIFPISKEEKGKIVLCGSGKEELLTCGSGSAGITTNRNTVLLKELKKVFGEDKIVVVRNLEEQVINEEDTVLVIISLSGMEGNDRKDLQMLSVDQEILEEGILLRKKKKFKLGLLMNTAGPVDITKYEPEIDGIFNLFLPGMQGAKAMVDMLSGTINPSGKLPITWPKRYQDTPTYLNFPGDGFEVCYGEGIYVGYRYYDKKQIEPLYHFGYGKSYTKFEVSDIRVDKNVFMDQIKLSGIIKNVGFMAGAEVLQLYVSDVVSSQSKPEKELKGFQKINLLPGEKKEFQFILQEKDLQYFDMDYDCFLVEEGYYDLILATSSAKEDIIHSSRVYFEGKSPYSYGLNSTIKVLYEKEELKQALLSWWKEEGLDRGILDSNYQYTNCKKLRDVIPEEIELSSDKNEKICRFLNNINTVEKI